MFVEISYPFSPGFILVPAGVPKPEIIPRSRTSPPPIDSGSEGVRWNSYNNTSFVKFFAHTGTHVDTPFHIDGTGKDIGAFGLTDFIFENPLFLSIPKADGDKITSKDLVPFEEQLRLADIVLVYTGFSRFRSTDPERYMNRQPGFSEEAAHYLTSFSNLRCVGIDAMGIENIPEGRRSVPPFPVHRAFLLKREKFLLLEDANLAPLAGKKLRRVFLIPLIVPGIEAMPVTAFAEVE